MFKENNTLPQVEAINTNTIDNKNSGFQETITWNYQDNGIIKPVSW